MIVCMKHRPILTALAIVGGVWTLTLGTVAVVKFGRLVDAIAGAAPLVPSVNGTDALPVPVQYGASADARAIASALRSIANAILAVG
ncbi:MAG: hypothetical protein OXC31_27690 [Spirochaetaceae bacterium]|nr:hypothetical protein [Spirochaetaceae bacterium]